MSAENDSEIKVLIACHCSGGDYHSPLYFQTNTGEKKNIEEIFESKNVFYLDSDPKCKGFERQYSSWEELPENTFSLLYLQHCPIYPSITTYKASSSYKGNPFQYELWKDILTYGVRSLFREGAVIIPIRSQISNSELTYYNIEERNSSNTYKNYKRKIGLFFRKGLVRLLKQMNITGLNVYLSKPSTYSKTSFLTKSPPLLLGPFSSSSKGQYLLLTRNQEGGKRKTRKVRR